LPTGRGLVPLADKLTMPPETSTPKDLTPGSLATRTYAPSMASRRALWSGGLLQGRGSDAGGRAPW
jgi:hypothetical protein